MEMPRVWYADAPSLRLSNQDVNMTFDAAWVDPDLLEFTTKPLLVADIGKSFNRTLELAFSMNQQTFETMSVTVTVDERSPLKVGFVRYDHNYLGMHKLHYALGDPSSQFMASAPISVSVLLSDIVEPDRSREQAEMLLKKGADLIVAVENYGTMAKNSLLDLIPLHPQVHFVLSSEPPLRYPNLATTFGRLYEACYIAGIVAGGSTKTSVIGFIASFPIPSTQRQINAFTLGAQEMNPNITVLVYYSHALKDDKFDTFAAYELIERGADVLIQGTAGLAAHEIFVSAGLQTIGMHHDLSVILSDAAVLCSAYTDWVPSLEVFTQAAIGDSFQPKNMWYGFDGGSVKVSGYSPLVPTDVVVYADLRRMQLQVGKLKLFCQPERPIVDITGRVRVSHDSCMSDEALQSNTWLVQGVEVMRAPTIFACGVDPKTGEQLVQVALAKEMVCMPCSDRSIKDPLFLSTCLRIASQSSNIALVRRPKTHLLP